jgi:uncharacterized membrane protein
MTLLNLDGFMFILRWLHFFFGVMWIGYLYYFNFTQGSFMAEADPAAKSGVVTKLVPRALYWFRWGAMWTFASGLLYLMLRGHQAGSVLVYTSSWGVAILTGALLGITMWANVWFIIWPNQKIVIKSATQVASGGSAIPEAAAAGARSTLASRTNTLFSIPMLFFMGAASHLALPVTSETNFAVLAAAIGVIWAALEFNALKGKLGPMTTVKGVITSGFVLTLIFYVVIEVCLRV